MIGWNMKWGWALEMWGQDDEVKEVSAGSRMYYMYDTLHSISISGLMV
jgi:hypothetical protein